jgi:hypothetical protein
VDEQLEPAACQLVALCWHCGVDSRLHKPRLAATRTCFNGQDKA